MAITGYGFPATVSAVDATLKELYNDSNYFDAAYKMRPTLAMLEKFEGMKGASNPGVRGYRVPVLTSRPQGVSADFASASTYATPSLLDAFIVTRVQHFGTFVIDGQTIAADMGDGATFANWLKTQSDALMESWSDQISSLIFGTGTGVFGQISAGSNVATKTITLAAINTVTLFEVGMSLGASATNTSSSTARLGTVTLDAVNRSLGTLHVKETTWATGIPAIAAGDYLFAKGNLNTVISGMASWNPATAPVFGTDSFYGVDRGADPTRLAGVTFQQGATNGSSYEEIMLDAVAYAYREGAQLTKCVMSTYDLAQLQKSQQSRIVLTRNPEMAMGRNGQGPIAGIGFTTYTLDCMGLRLDIYADNKCPQGTAFAFGDDSYVLGSIGKAPRFLDFDGLWIRAIPLNDVYQARIGFYGNLFSRRTNNMLNIGFPPGNALP